EGDLLFGRREQERSAFLNSKNSARHSGNHHIIVSCPLGHRGAIPDSYRPEVQLVWIERLVHPEFWYLESFNIVDDWTWQPVRQLTIVEDRMIDNEVVGDIRRNKL